MTEKDPTRQENGGGGGGGEERESLRKFNML